MKSRPSCAVCVRTRSRMCRYLPASHNCVRILRSVSLFIAEDSSTVGGGSKSGRSKRKPFAKISLSLPRSCFVEFCSAARHCRYNSGIPTWFPADPGHDACDLFAPIFSLLPSHAAAESRLRAPPGALFDVNGKCPTAVGHSHTYTHCSVYLKARQICIFFSDFERECIVRLDSGG